MDEPTTTDLICGLITGVMLLGVVWTLAAIL